MLAFRFWRIYCCICCILRNFVREKNRFLLYNSLKTLKDKCCHFEEISLTGFSESVQNDIFWRSHWRTKFPQNDVINELTISITVGDGIFKCIFINEKFCILIRISLYLFPRVQLTISRHWCWTSHYLKRCWSSSLMHIYSALAGWVTWC